MLHANENALICDFAETYHVFDWRSLPVRTAAILANGLPDTSRIKRHMAGSRVGLTELLLAVIADRLGFLCWAKSKDAEHNRNRPQSIYELLTNTAPKEVQRAFTSADDFEAARASILGK